MSLNLPLIGTFKPGVRMTLFVAVFLPLTLVLGFWQLDRATQKGDMQEAYLVSITQLPTAPRAQERPQDFQRLRLTGALTDKIFLVDNQVNAGKPGYWIIQVLAEATSGRLWLVNRGFTMQGESRDQLPVLPVVEKPVTVVGIVWPFTGLIPLLADDVWTSQWPQRVQRLNVKKMAALTGAEPVELRLESSQWAQQPAPFVSVLDEDKNMGYAATWFALAIALSILYLVWGTRDGRN
jgi:surfeit locus 1 family protein